MKIFNFKSFFGKIFGYSKDDYFLLERYLKRLEFELNQKPGCGKLTIYTNPVDCISPSSCLIDDINNFSDPNKNAFLIAEFLISNPKGLPIITLKMGKNVTVINKSRKLDVEEIDAFREILPFKLEEVNIEKAFSLFASKVNFISCHEEIKTRMDDIHLKETELNGMLKKEHTEPIIKGVRIMQNQLMKLKKEFNEVHGETYPL